MIHNGIKEDKTTTLIVDLSKDIFCNCISRQRGFMSIQILYFVDASAQDEIIVCGANWYTVGVSELFNDLRKHRPVIILWQCYLHIQIHVVKHVWRVIVSLRNYVVVIYPQKFFFEVFVIINALVPTLRVEFITNIVTSNNLQLLRNHGVKLIKYIFSA